MTKENDAYQRALKIIEEAEKNNSRSILFDEKECYDLSEIPPNISNLTNLSRVSFENTKISDLTPISNMTTIDTLSLESTQVVDLTPIAGLTGMRTLILDSTKVTDLSPISELIEIQILMLDNTRVADLTPLSGLTSMQTLMLDNTHITDLAPLSELNSMQSLWFKNTKIYDLAPLSGMSRMKLLFMNETQVSDLKPISGLTEIQALGLDNTKVSDLTPLSGMKSIDTLMLDNTPVSNLAPLSGLSEIVSLWLKGTKIFDLSHISGMTKMERLWIDSTEVSDLGPLSGMTAMKMLSFANTEVSDLTPLSNMTAMERLYLYNTKVADLTPIKNMNNLIGGSDSGVSFFNTPASQKEKLHEISIIEDVSIRTVELLSYLNEPTPPPQDQNDVPPMKVGSDGIVRSQDFAPQGSSDPDQEDMRQEVLRKVGDLISVVGTSNEWAGLAITAKHYQSQVDKPLNELKLGLLYSAFNTLRLTMEAEQSAQAQSRVNDYLPPKIGAALIDLVQTHGLFYMGFSEGAEIHAKAISGLTVASSSLPPEAGEIVKSLNGKTTVLDAEDYAAMQDDLVAASGEGKSAQIGVARLRARIWNMMGAIGRASWTGGKWSTLALAAHDLPAWMIGNQTVISKFLIWAQGPGAIWFQQMLQAFR